MINITYHDPEKYKPNEGELVLGYLFTTHKSQYAYSYSILQYKNNQYHELQSIFQYNPKLLSKSQIQLAGWAIIDKNMGIDLLKINRTLMNKKILN